MFIVAVEVYKYVRSLHRFLVCVNNIDITWFFPGRSLIDLCIQTGGVVSALFNTFGSIVLSWGLARAGFISSFAKRRPTQNEMPFVRV